MNNICPGCGAGYNVTPQHVGRQLACKKCGAMLVVKVDGLHLATAEPIVPSAEPAYPDEREDYAGERAFARPGAREDREDREDEAGSTAFADFLAFRRMLVPVIIQIIFWVLVVGVVVLSILLIAGGNMEQIVIGIIMLPLGPFAVRIMCESMIVVFRINETLTDLRNMIKDMKK